MKWEYLAFNLIIFFSPFLGSLFYKKMVFPSAKRAVRSIVPVATVFIGIDVLVTNIFWSFNPVYILGWNFFTVPIEELMFFFTVPWSCLVLWIPIQKKYHSSMRIPLGNYLFGGVSVFVFLLSFQNQLWYTSAITLSIFIGSLFVPWNLLKVSWLVFTGVIISLTLVFNGYLTSRPIVVYNPQYMTNVRIGTIPLEDILYGCIFVLSVVVLYEKQKKAPVSYVSSTTSEQL